MKRRISRIGEIITADQTYPPCPTCGLEMEPFSNSWNKSGGQVIAGFVCRFDGEKKKNMKDSIRKSQELIAYEIKMILAMNKHLSL